MKIIHLGLAKEGKKYIWVTLILITLLTSCQQKGKECVIIKNNSYKGYGFFYFKNRFQDSFTELRFIPVCAEKEDLLHFRNLNPQTGLDFYCFYDDSFLRTLALHSKIVSEEFGFETYLTPVYIEFEETPDFQEQFVKLYHYPDYISLNNRDTLMVNYVFSGAHLSNIKIDKIEFFSFVEE
jgi:hypothetical protein